MVKFAWSMAAIVAAVAISFGALFFHERSKVSDLNSKITLQTAEITQLKGSLEAAKAVTGFKEVEISQTNILLDECYKAISATTKDFEDIDQIMKLPTEGGSIALDDQTKEVTNASSPQNSAAVSFINQQLSAVD